MEQSVLTCESSTSQPALEQDVPLQKRIRSREELIESHREKRLKSEMAHIAFLETPYGELGGRQSDYDSQQQAIDTILEGMWSRERDRAIELGFFDVSKDDYEAMTQREQKRYARAVRQYTERLKNTSISHVIRVNIEDIEDEMDTAGVPALQQYKDPVTGKLPTKQEFSQYAGAIDEFKKWIFGHPVSRRAKEQIPQLSAKEKTTPVDVTLYYDGNGKLRCDNRTA